MKFEKLVACTSNQRSLTVCVCKHALLIYTQTVSVCNFDERTARILMTTHTEYTYFDTVACKKLAFLCRNNNN